MFPGVMGHGLGKTLYGSCASNPWHSRATTQVMLCQIWEYLEHDSVVRGVRVTGVPAEMQELEAGSAMRTTPCKRRHASVST